MNEMEAPVPAVDASPGVLHGQDGREVMADVWLGFTEEQVRDWLTEAGLADITYSSAAVPAPLEDDTESRLSAFVATATKTVGT